jgi:hypothetical protein
MSDDLELSDEVSLIAHSIDTQMPDSAKLLWDLADAIPMTTEDWRDHHSMLKGHGRSGSAAAADCMRHVAVGMQKILDEVEIPGRKEDWVRCTPRYT